jgi:hypothetical protein
MLAQQSKIDVLSVKAAGYHGSVFNHLDAGEPKRFAFADRLGYPVMINRRGDAGAERTRRNRRAD